MHRQKYRAEKTRSSISFMSDNQNSLTWRRSIGGLYVSWRNQADLITEPGFEPTGSIIMIDDLQYRIRWKTQFILVLSIVWKNGDVLNWFARLSSDRWWFGNRHRLDLHTTSRKPTGTCRLIGKLFKRENTLESPFTPGQRTYSNLSFAPSLIVFVSDVNQLILFKG